MAVEHTNRNGKRYYLREGKTKTGKPRYFFSIKPEGKGKVVDRIPDGYEIYEHPENAQVFLRKARPQLITDIEKQLVKRAVKALQRSKRYLIDCKDEFITVYESSFDAEELKDVFGVLLEPPFIRPGITVSDAVDMLVNSSDNHYTAMLRFRLVDEKRRKFKAERFCFRGSIDDWIHLQGPDNLKTLVDRHVRLLGKDEFFNTPF